MPDCPIPEGVCPDLFVPNPGTGNANPPDVGFLALVAEDFHTHHRDPFSQGFWTIFWHRFGNWRMGIRSRALRIPFTIVYRAMSRVAEWMTGIHLPYPVRLGRRVRLDHFGGMILVPQSIGDDVVLRQNTTMGIARVSEPQEQRRYRGGRGHHRAGPCRRWRGYRGEFRGRGPHSRGDHGGRCTGASGRCRQDRRERLAPRAAHSKLSSSGFHSSPSASGSSGTLRSTSGSLASMTRMSLSLIPGKEAITA